MGKEACAYSLENEYSYNLLLIRMLSSSNRSQLNMLPVVVGPKKYGDPKDLCFTFDNKTHAGRSSLKLENWNI